MMNALPIVPYPSDFNGRLLLDEPMAKHTSWHAGGPADAYFLPRDISDLAAFLRKLEPGTPILWLGLGSNILIRDGGFRGVVIALQAAAQAVERRSETQVFVGAGVACARIAKQCVKWGLGPAEFFAGIPGTLGGALAMNAGAFGGETWNHVVEVEIMDMTGQRRLRAAGEYTVGYRHVEGPAGECFIAARLEFRKAPEVNQASIRALLEKRKASQPIGAWSCGSVFTNPPGDHAARLIEAAGLKGAHIGGASVSTKHANFIINHGSASAADLEELIIHVQTSVEAQFGVALQTEVRIIGEPQ
jgi:UDP-N-acetylmuramate dehydrogenase